jgi:L-ribulokinase
MQIYADVTGLEMKVARSAQTCALGSAIAGAVAAGGHADFASAQAAMCGLKAKTYKPDAGRHRVYEEIYPLYRKIHDAFGTPGWTGSLYSVMKDLLDIRDRQLS